MGWLDRLAGKKTATDNDIASAMVRASEAVERGDHTAALAIWGPLAHAGIGRAQNNIGACFAEGLGVARDPALALRWLTLAAESGDPVGQRNLAALHFKGDGVAQNDDEALRLYRLAAEQGDPRRRTCYPGCCWKAGASPIARRRCAGRGRRPKPASPPA